MRLNSSGYEGNEKGDEHARQGVASKYIVTEYLVVLSEKQLKNGPRFNTTKPGLRHQVSIMGNNLLLDQATKELKYYYNVTDFS